MSQSIEEIHEGIIFREANAIRGRIIGGRIYGEEVKSIDSQILASYWLGKMDAGWESDKIAGILKEE